MWGFVAGVVWAAMAWCCWCAGSGRPFLPPGDSSAAGWLARRGGPRCGCGRYRMPWDLNSVAASGVVHERERCQPVRETVR